MIWQYGYDHTKSVIIDIWQLSIGESKNISAGGENGHLQKTGTVTEVGHLWMWAILGAHASKQKVAHRMDD